MKLIIECRGGNVVGCYSESRDVEVVLVDWDNIVNGNRPDAMMVSHVSEMPNETINALAHRKN